LRNKTLPLLWDADAGIHRIGFVDAIDQ